MNQQPAKSFSLEQNIPNPFKFTTMFRYSLPERSNVLLEIFDTEGLTMDTLVKCEQEAGIWTIVWTAGEVFRPGTYFCRMTASGSESPSETFVQLRKMGLAK